MKLLQLFENMQPFPNTREEVEAMLKRYRIRNYTINLDLSVDVDGNVDLCSENLESIPIIFRNIESDFRIYDNNLLSLKGSPVYVGGNFLMFNNKELTSLKGAPREVGNEFNCSFCNLHSLKGAPREVGGSFLCHENPNLKSLSGMGIVHGKIISDIS